MRRMRLIVADGHSTPHSDNKCVNGTSGCAGTQQSSVRVPTSGKVKRTVNDAARCAQVQLAFYCTGPLNPHTLLPVRVLLFGWHLVTLVTLTLFCELKLNSIVIL